MTLMREIGLRKNIKCGHGYYQPGHVRLKAPVFGIRLPLCIIPNRLLNRSIVICIVKACPGDAP